MQGRAIYMGVGLILNDKCLVIGVPLFKERRYLMIRTEDQAAECGGAVNRYVYTQNIYVICN